MRKALVASLALHVVLGAALLASQDDRDGAGAAGKPAPVAIEIVAPPTIAPPHETPPVDVQGGGASRSRASAPATRRSDSARKTRSNRRSPLSSSELGAYTIDRAGSDHVTSGGADADGDGGEGSGVGGNRGAGIGFGDGGKIVIAEEPFALPPPPRVSKARPAKLIYPTRERDLGEDRLFVARVTVDSDGYVVGARLVRGVTGPRDDEAADLIFRFRYLPALDDDGRAIRSTFDQPFHVGR